MLFLVIGYLVVGFLSGRYIASRWGALACGVLGACVILFLEYQAMTIPSIQDAYLSLTNIFMLLFLSTMGVAAGARRAQMMRQKHELAQEIDKGER